MRSARGEAGSGDGIGFAKLPHFGVCAAGSCAGKTSGFFHNGENGVRTAHRADILPAMSIRTPVLRRTGAGVLVAFAFLLASCGEAPKQPPAPPLAKVTVAPPVQRTIVDQDEYVGRFDNGSLHRW